MTRALSITLALAACSSSTTKTVPTAPTPTAPTPTAPAPTTTIAPLVSPTQVPLPRPIPILHSFPGIDLLESENAEMHEHGGSAARVYYVSLSFDVNDRRTHEIEARQIELLRRHCAEVKWHTRTKLQILGYQATWNEAATTEVASARGAGRLVLPAAVPRRYTVMVRIEPVEVYQACDAFGFALDIVVDRVRHTFELPLDVTRIEPLE